MKKKVEKIWENRAELNTEKMYEIANKYNYSLPFSAILQKRGINIEALRNDNLMYDAMLLPDMDKAIDIITSRIKEKSRVKIGVVNDYDVDGATSGVILKECLDYLGADAFIITPDRNIDGYGISMRIIDEVEKNGCNFIITTDNGISAKEQIDYAKKKGMTVIVTDHHEVPFELNADGEKTEILPNADAIIDQKRCSSIYPFRDICGAMIAYKLSVALLGTIPSLYPMEEERLVTRWTELAGIGTICDIMPLVSENRTVVKKAIDIIKNGSSYIGIRQLIKELSIDNQKFNAYNIAFGIGPCINACGRMTGSVDTAIALLLEKDFVKAGKLAKQIKELNDERKKLSIDSENYALRLVEDMPEDAGIYILYLENNSPHIMGIVAGRIKDATGRPCICVTDSKDGILKGSGRSVEGYNMFEYLSKHKDMYEGFGGHELAVGISFKKDKLKDITNALNKDMESLDKSIFVKRTLVDLFIEFNKITETFINEMNSLEPYGCENAKPVLGIKDAQIVKMSRMGKEKNFLKLQLKRENVTYDAVCFENADAFDEEVRNKYGEKALKEAYMGTGEILMDFLYTPSLNTWNNRTTIQFIINDYR